MTLRNDLAIVVPVHHRPAALVPLLDNITLTTPDATVIIMPTPEDEATITQLERIQETGRYPKLCWFVIDGALQWSTKLNLAYKLVGDGYRYLFTGADDIVFTPGWLDAALDKMQRGIMVVGTRDMLTTVVMDGAHATHFLVDTDYLIDPGGVVDEGPGSFLYEGYRHNYADDEFIRTAKARYRFAMSEAVVRHLHHLSGATSYDDTYKIGDDSKQADSILFESRRHLWET